MLFRRSLAALALVSLVAGCATTIAPTYTSEKQNIMRIGGDKPSSKEPSVESTGSFCVQTSEVWHEDGTTPDGQTLWAKDTMRKVVPCQ
jgi:hypothetical protein